MEWKAARIDYLAISVPNPSREAKALALSKYALQDVLKLKFKKQDKYRAGKTIQQWVKAEAARLKEYVSSKEVVKMATSGEGLSLRAHMVIIVGSRHVLVWDMDGDGNLAKMPYLAM